MDSIFDWLQQILSQGGGAAGAAAAGANTPSPGLPASGDPAAEVAADVAADPTGMGPAASSASPPNQNLIKGFQALNGLGQKLAPQQQAQPQRPMAGAGGSSPIHTGGGGGSLLDLVFGRRNQFGGY